MVPIEKSAEVPVVLATKGRDGIQALCDLYDADPSAYQSAAGKTDKEIRKFTIDSSIYGHATVKAQLIADQFGKCCYCEAHFTANGYGDVEHYRPKAAYMSLLSTVLIYPGYYWLAYDWGNLIFSCQICNQQFKKNHFALQDETKRAKNHHGHAALVQEIPLMVDPVREDPLEHVTFVREVIVAKDGSPRGHYTIEKFGLDRTALADARQAKLEDVERALTFAEIDLQEPEDVKFFCKAFSLDKAELTKMVTKALQVKTTAALAKSPFAGMIRTNFPALPTK